MELTEEDIDFLSSQAAPLELDVIKLSEENMNAVLTSYLGIGLEQTKQIGMERFYYNAEDRMYYLVHSDSNAVYIQVNSGSWNEDGTLTLIYSTAESPKWPADSRLYQAILKPDGDNYLFYSNELTE